MILVCNCTPDRLLKRTEPTGAWIYYQTVAAGLWTVEKYDLATHRCSHQSWNDWSMHLDMNILPYFLTLYRPNHETDLQTVDSIDYSLVGLQLMYKTVSSYLGLLAINQLWFLLNSLLHTMLENSQKMTHAHSNYNNIQQKSSKSSHLRSWNQRMV